MWGTVWQKGLAEGSLVYPCRFWPWNDCRHAKSTGKPVSDPPPPRPSDPQCTYTYEAIYEVMHYPAYDLHYLDPDLYTCVDTGRANKVLDPKGLLSSKDWTPPLRPSTHSLSIQRHVIESALEGPSLAEAPLPEGLSLLTEAETRAWFERSTRNCSVCAVTNSAYSTGGIAICDAEGCNKAYCLICLGRAKLPPPEKSFWGPCHPMRAVPQPESYSTSTRLVDVLEPKAPKQPRGKRAAEPRMPVIKEEPTNGEPSKAKPGTALNAPRRSTRESVVVASTKAQEKAAAKLLEHKRDTILPADQRPFPLDQELSKETKDQLRDLSSESHSEDSEAAFEMRYKIDFTKGDMNRLTNFSSHVTDLQSPRWLNDNVIDFVGHTIRRNVLHHREGMVMLTGTFLYKRLMSGPGGTYSFDAVKLWNSDEDITNGFLETIAVPINVGNLHWVVAILRPDQRTAEVFDSSQSERHSARDREICANLVRWYKDNLIYASVPNTDLRIKCPWDLAPTSGPPSPQQTNGFDCGVFVLTRIWCAFMGHQLNYAQRHMANIRGQFAQAIMREAFLELPPKGPKNPRKVMEKLRLKAASTASHTMGRSPHRTTPPRDKGKRPAREMQSTKPPKEVSLAALYPKSSKPRQSRTARDESQRSPGASGATAASASPALSGETESGTTATSTEQVGTCATTQVVREFTAGHSSDPGLQIPAALEFEPTDTPPP